jgi:hypothetical protein
VRAFLMGQKMKWKKACVEDEKCPLCMPVFLEWRQSYGNRNDLGAHSEGKQIFPVAKRTFSRKTGQTRNENEKKAVIRLKTRLFSFSFQFDRLTRKKMMQDSRAVQISRRKPSIPFLFFWHFFDGTEWPASISSHFYPVRRSNWNRSAAKTLLYHFCWFPISISSL